MNLHTEITTLPDSLPKQTEIHFLDSLKTSYLKTDRIFAGLMICQWILGIFVAFYYSSQIDSRQNGLWNISFKQGVFFSSLFALTSLLLIYFRPGKPETRYTISITQVLMASLITFLTGTHPEFHAHIFVSLVFLSFYRDWRVLIPAIMFGLFEHFFHYLPVSDSAAELYSNGMENWIRHTWWLIPVTLLLASSCLRSEKEKWRNAETIAQLDASEERYRKFFDEAEDLIYRTDKNGYFSFVNPAFSKVLGYNLDKNLRYTEIIAPTNKREAIKFYTRQRRKDIQSTYYELPIITASGNTVWIGQRVQLIYENGEVAGFQAFARDITEIKNIQSELKNSEEKYRFLTNFVPQHVWKMNIEGQLTYGNNPTYKYFGLDPKESIPPLGWKEVIHPDDVNFCVSGWIQAIKERKLFENEYRVKRFDGEYRWVLGQALPIVDEKNRVVEFFGTSTDIHERKMAQEEAAKNREYLNLFKHANDAIVIYDPHNGEILNVNDFACSTFGYTRDELIGSDLNAICLNPLNRSQMHEKLLQEKSAETYQSSLIRKDGTPINLSVNSSLIEFRGKPAILSINRDITANLKADQALRKNENKLQSLINNMTEGLVEVDRNEQILFANSRFCEMTGYTPEELIGQNISQLILDEEGRKRVEEAHQKRYQGASETYELKIYHKSGKPVWALVGGVPITDADGNVIGSMGVHTDITERKENEDLLRFNATHDALTGLPNRNLLLEHMQSSLNRVTRHSTDKFAVLFLDLNRFKIVNDSLGHMEGDKLLIMIARRLEECVRSGDIIARLGGDEFTILLNKISGMSEILPAVRRIQESLKLPFRLGEREIFIGTSIGIVISNQNYNKPEEILRDADIAMYRAKKSGKSHYEIFNQEMHEQANLRLQLETEMRFAIERKEFQIYYQPIIELATNRIAGFEALIRWAHSSRGMISPLDFIPLAEETGLIIPIGEWILRESCRQIRKWQLLSPLNSELSISVNLSCKQFDQEDLIERVRQILLEANLSPEFLRLEITESHLMEDDNKSIETINKLRDLGVKISIDDFGTGYSSLSYLHQLPANYLKIDRSFIKQMHENQENSEIVRTILILAQNLGFSVIAEGIETEAQADQLKNFTCDFGQGFLYSKPLEAKYIEELLKDTVSQNPVFSNINLISETIS